MKLTEIRLQNPYVDETIKVTESFEDITFQLDLIKQGVTNILLLHQIEPVKRLITVNPGNHAKIDYYEIKGENKK